MIHYNRRWSKMKLIERKKYLNTLIDVINTPIIKVIIGGWRSGKSKLLDAFYDIIWIDDFGQNLISLTV